MTVWRRRATVTCASLCIRLAKVALIQLLGPGKSTLARSALAAGVLNDKFLPSNSQLVTSTAGWGNVSCVSQQWPAISRVSSQMKLPGAS